MGLNGKTILVVGENDAPSGYWASHFHEQICDHRYTFAIQNDHGEDLDSQDACHILYLQAETKISDLLISSISKLEPSKITA